MLTKFYEDLFLYNTIKDVTNFTEDSQIEFIFDKLYLNEIEGKTWTISQIERLAEEARHK